MVDNSTLRIESTDAGAGVDTVLVGTGQTGDTVTVDDALRAAAAVGISEVVWPAATDAGAASHLGVSIGATGVGVTGISRWWWS